MAAVTAAVAVGSAAAYNVSKSSKKAAKSAEKGANSQADAAAAAESTDKYLKGHVTDELSTIDNTTQDIYDRQEGYQRDNERYFLNQKDLVKDGFADQEKLLGNISDDMGDGFSNLSEGQKGITDSIDTRMDKSDKAMEKGFTGVNDSLATGVKTITDNVDTRTGEIKTSLNENFDNTNTLLDTGLGNLSTQMDKNDSALLDTTLTGFGAVGDNLSSMEGNLSNQLTDTSTNVLGATDQIQALIEKYGGDSAQYYADLSAGQTALKQGQGSLQGGLDDFRSDFGSYSNLANQTRSQLGASVVGGFDAVGSAMDSEAKANAQKLQGINSNINTQAANVTSQIDTNQDSTIQNFGDIASSINSESSTVQDKLEDTETASNLNFSGIATDIATGQAQNTAEGQVMQAEFVSKLTDVQTILQSDNAVLDEATRKNYQMLVDSFDEQGALIETSQTQTGSTISRAIAETGGLVISEVEDTGTLLAQQTLDIDSMLGVLDSSQKQAMDTGFNSIATDQAQGFSDLNTSVTTGLAGNALQNEQVQLNLTSNMDQLRAIMETQGGLMGEDLAQGFTSLLNSFDSQGQLITNSLDATGNFITREIDASGNLIVNTLDANTGELLNSEKYNTELLSEDLTSRFDSTEDAIRVVGASINQVGDDIQQDLLSTASGVEDGFTSRFDEISDQQLAGQQEFLNRLQQAEAFIVADVAGVDQGLKNSISAVSDAFDETGKLVQNSIDRNGNYLNRAIDEQGSLILTTFSSVNGQRLDRQAINIDRILKEVANLSLIYGSNAQMAAESPTIGATPPTSPYSGLASPYAQTN